MKKSVPEFGELYFSDLLGRALKRARIAEVFLGMDVMLIVKLLDAIAKEAYALGHAAALKDLRAFVDKEREKSRDECEPEWAGALGYVVELIDRSAYVEKKKGKKS